MRKRSLGRSVVTLISTVVLFMFIFSGSVLAETFTLTVGGGTPPDAWPPLKVLRDYWCAEVKAQVESKTPHKIKYNFAWMSLTKPSEDLEAVERGILHVSVPLAVFEPTKLFLHSFSHYAPFGTADLMLATKVNLDVYEKFPYLRETFEKKFKQKWLGVFTYEDYDLLSTFPIKTLNDLKGKKIGCAGLPCPWIANIGVVPVKSGFNEAYSSMQTGVYNGFVGFLTGYYNYKFYEVAKHYTYAGLGCASGGSLTVNMKMWDSLPKEIQDIMIDVGKKYPYEVAKEITSRRAEVKGLLEKQGIQFHTLSLEDRRTWMKAMGNMANDRAKEADKMGLPGSQVIKYYVEAMAKAGYEWPIKWDIK
jgi:C4-dicarboxylate-binding protein DctP